ncbi:MAG: hypothetical protein CVU64_10330 [Deltaproteobacteria bacterium HGW-Deltaproteobacteria-21]|nr:MAG: hypothetical protein CVU64_10330 [Deltaproteobacteria bacterium HGW-Deltaproteobacteria-21]
MKSRIRSGVIVSLILLCSGLIPAGCTYNSVQLAGGKNFTIERVESSPIYVSWVYAEEKNKEMIVSGFLRSHFTHTQGTGHVDVAVIAPGGELLGQTSVHYDPKTIPTRFRGKESHFEARFPFLPPDGSRIRVKLHYSPVLELKDSDSDNNRAVNQNAL